MTDMHDRLKKIVDESGRSHRSISLAAGLAPGTLSDILKNFDRSPSVASVTALANTLGVSVSWLIDGHGDNAIRGFSESDTTPWIAPEPKGQRPDLDYRRLAQMLSPNARNADTLRLARNAAGFGLYRNDILVVDLKRPAEPGDLVIAQVADLESGEATTALRRYLPPYLVSDQPDSPALMADGVRTSIMGPVTASFRAPELSG